MYTLIVEYINLLRVKCVHVHVGVGVLTDHNISKSLEDVSEFIDTDILGDIANKQRVSRLQEECHTSFSHSQCIVLHVHVHVHVFK